ncbi:hypothetical protein Syun_023152 [Stephania yunnanensis]|uniref:Strictosidine synthase conserved region domain-containing protein n=1 Tax=Stephania yunnanensis TaxID=152371 RepID=A0AAP0F9B5_9MAGN
MEDEVLIEEDKMEMAILMTISRDLVAFTLAVISSDKSGRLMKYNPRSQRVIVLLNGFRVANGVALNRNNSFILVAKTAKNWNAPYVSFYPRPLPAQPLSPHHYSQNLPFLFQ